MVKIRCIAMSLLFLAACDSKPAATGEGKPPRKETVNPDNPDACAECHAQIVAEWKESMHARAHYDSDPIFAGVRAVVTANLGEEQAAECARCHSPRDAKNPDSPAGKLGVSCATCHMLDEVHVGQGKSGVDALKFAEVVRMRAGHDMAPGSSPAHATGAAPEFIKDRKTVCLACHDVSTNPSGVETCATGSEFKDRAATDQGCIDCHMPRIEGPGGMVGSRSEHARHVFLGPHRAWYADETDFIAEKVSLAGTLSATTLNVTVKNGTGHAFPTGFPGRIALVVAHGKDASGAVVWKNVDADPMKDSPDSVFNKVYGDENGKPTLPVLSKSLLRDNRIKPAETRTLTFTVPEAVASVELKLVMRLVPPAAHEKLGLMGKVEAEPRTISTVTVSR